MNDHTAKKQELLSEAERLRKRKAQNQEIQDRIDDLRRQRKERLEERERMRLETMRLDADRERMAAERERAAAERARAAAERERTAAERQAERKRMDDAYNAEVQQLRQKIKDGEDRLARVSHVNTNIYNSI